MPNYKTHSIHGEVILPNIDKRIEIDKEYLKIFCMGPDSMITTDYKIFDYQHYNNVKQYFETLLKLIKENKLQDNSVVMSFLYGQIDHYILDIVMHPLIYYMTEDMPKQNMLNPHGIIEMWIDEYVLKKFNEDEAYSYKKLNINDNDLKKIINELYKEVYNDNFVYTKYKNGIKMINMFDTLIRKNGIKIAPLITKLLNIGDITYHNNFDQVLPYLNLDNEIWYNPETGEVSHESFDDLWKKSQEESLETIEDINNYLYLDKPIHNPYILNNVSYNTGLPCEDGQHFQYVKKYKKDY